MGQKGFFDVERRLEAISAKGDPLETIKKIVRWEDFRRPPPTGRAFPNRQLKRRSVGAFCPAH